VRKTACTIVQSVFTHRHTRVTVHGKESTAEDNAPPLHSSCALVLVSGSESPKGYMDSGMGGAEDRVLGSEVDGLTQRSGPSPQDQSIPERPIRDGQYFRRRRRLIRCAVASLLHLVRGCCRSGHNTRYRHHPVRPRLGA
jgi:hypothetical protein